MKASAPDGAVFTFKTTGRCSSCGDDSSKLIVAVSSRSRNANAAMSCDECSDRVFEVMQDYLDDVLEAERNESGIVH
jgi:hypothetical protein